MTARIEVAKTHKLFINGAFPRSESGRTLELKRGRGDVISHVARASRKDLRDAVEAARAAMPRWAAMTAYNRGQILYRIAEMLESRHDEFVHALELSGSKPHRRGRTPAVHRDEVSASIDRLIAFAGWADKFAQVLGCQNPVAGPYYNFTAPEPTGTVAVIAPDEPALLGLVTLITAPLCAGNVIVALASQANPIPGVLLGELCATADVPPGVVNILTGVRSELLEHIAGHREINAISAAHCSSNEAAMLQSGTADNLKRVHITALAKDDWFDSSICESPWAIEPFVEMKTIWHPAAM